MVSFNPAITERLNDLSNTLLSGHYIFSRDFDDKYLASRYSKPEKYPHNISYGPTKDIHHVNQYYMIRLEAYNSIIGSNFYAGKDKYDEHSEIFAALAGNNCIGGVRLTVSSPDISRLMPMENHGFYIKNQFLELDLNKITYCEASRLALLPDFRNNGQIWDELQIKSTKYLIDDKGMEIGFGQSGALQTRRFKSQFKNMGYDLIVHKNVKTADAQMHEYLNVQFWSIDFTPDRKYTEILNNYSQPAQVKEKAFA